MDGHQLATSVAVLVQDKLLLDAVADERDGQDPSVQKLQSAVSSALAELDRDFAYTQKTATDTADVGVTGYIAYDDIVVPDCVSAEMLAQLVARNYCILCGRVDEADVFDGVYDGYAVALRLKRKVKMRPRKFL
ncbi:MAG: hypothetical protein K2F90_02930 [Clostridiales bacterium]|nr:hypothetical protein [Clostridiales bacterium]